MVTYVCFRKIIERNFLVKLFLTFFLLRTGRKVAGMDLCGERVEMGREGNERSLIGVSFARSRISCVEGKRQKKPVSERLYFTIGTMIGTS